MVVSGFIFLTPTKYILPKIPQNSKMHTTYNGILFLNYNITIIDGYKHLATNLYGDFSFAAAKFHNLLLIQFDNLFWFVKNSKLKISKVQNVDNIFL